MKILKKFFAFFFLLEFGTEPKALRVLDKFFTDLHHIPSPCYFMLFYFTFFFLRQSHYVVQASLKFVILSLPHLLELQVWASIHTTEMVLLREALIL